MLVISRRKNEGVVISHDIIVTVVEIREDKVRLGVISPKEVLVHRQEVHEAIHGRPALPPEPRPRSPEERAFLQAIEENPDDPALRLVFADWLEERGDPLGEFLRIQCQQKILAQRAGALWAEHGEGWRRCLPPLLWW